MATLRSHLLLLFSLIFLINFALYSSTKEKQNVAISRLESRKLQSLSLQIPYLSDLTEEIPFLATILSFLPLPSSLTDSFATPEEPFSCPAPGEDPVEVPHRKLVKFGPAPAGSLCTLVLKTTQCSGIGFRIFGIQILSADSTESLVAIARSFDGNEWKASPGPFDTQSFDCEDGFCETLIETRPKRTIFPFSNSKFELRTTSEKREITSQDIVARFLEQATFGVKMDNLVEWENLKISDLTANSTSFAQWIKDQIYFIPPTSHRKRFREQANTRARFTKNHGSPQHPCSSNSIWHSFSFRMKDASTDEVTRYITVETVDTGSNSISYLMSMDNLTRTEVTTFTFDDLDTEFDVIADFPMNLTVCEVEEKIGGTFKLNVGGSCRSFTGGNPPISFDSASLSRPDYIITKDASSFADFTAVPGRSTPDSYFNGDEITESICASLQIGDYPVFIDFGDGADPQWLSFDPHLALLENTIENPIVQEVNNETRSPNVARNFLNAESCLLSESLVIACGSHNEVPNDLSKGNTGYSFYLGDGTDDVDDRSLQRQRDAIWTDVVISADDQLRQRMAWALNQLFAIDPIEVGARQQTEGFMNYYDIFVRNAFGNYFDILKEVSYSPFMAEMLTFIRSKSSAYILETTSATTFPDENYAREIMQLFSIGTILINMDGTPILDPVTNDEIPSYTNEHIAVLSRAWTGFDMQAERGNVEIGSTYLNRIDPMQIVPDWRDVFPKANLYGGFIGDGYPLCEDMPERSYLRKGAVYRLLGSNPDLELSKNPPSEFDPTTLRFTLSSDSELYSKLCQQEVNETDCNFQSLVTLDENLLCIGDECFVDTVRQVEVTPDIYFEYVRQPCVELSFYNDSKTVRLGNESQAMCANPNTAIAGEACCEDDTIERDCKYFNERVIYDTAERRCNATQSLLCDAVPSCSSPCCDFLGQYFWQNKQCSVQAKISAETGEIAIVHRPDDLDLGVNPFFDFDSENFFDVLWKDGLYPIPENDNCGGNDFCLVTREFCYCDMIVKNTPVYLEAPSIDEVSELLIGSMNPDTFDEGTYEEAIIENGVQIFFRNGTSYDTDTIFGVNVNNKTKYFKNMISNVQIGSFSFVNPPHFMNFVELDSRDAHYETDAVLEQYLQHPNVPPFISKHFLLRFGISNPSPAYVEDVANAFKNGIYEYEGISFGSTKFGDLEASIAAILLNEESRNLFLDLDPAYGGLREPLIKVIAMMRSLDFNPFQEFSGTNTLLDDMTSKINQMAYDFPNVFSFFRDDYSPPGPISQSSLVAPEGERYLTPYIIGLMNGLFSMVNYGLSDCDQGFGLPGSESCQNGNYASGQGNLTYIQPSPTQGETTVNELATLLTAGRLNERSREIIKLGFLFADNEIEGLRTAQKLMVSTPEFHGTGLIELRSEPLPIPEPKEPTTNDFKAMIYLYFSGGMDSYNLIVPYTGCFKKNMYDEYSQVRGNIALDNSTLLPIFIGGEEQECDYFGIHPDLPVAKELYDDGDLAFFCNVGNLFEEVTNEDWREKTKTQLFAHNAQERESQEVDPMGVYEGSGFLGRMNEVLTANGYNAGSVSVASSNYVLIGDPSKSQSPIYVDERGIKDVFPGASDEFRQTVSDLNNPTNFSSSLFGRTWSKLFLDSIEQTELMKKAVESASLVNDAAFPDTSIGRQLKMVAKILDGKDELGLDRLSFYVNMGGFDTHVNQQDRLSENFQQLNDALDAFVKEMRDQDLWSKVAVMSSSDFGRTLIPNGGGGTDHGWGGNSFVLSGSLHGGRILGKYPDDLTPSGPQTLSRGRMIPTTSWDAIINGLAQWFGVVEDLDLDIVLPNRQKFTKLYQGFELFKP